MNIPLKTLLKLLIVFTFSAFIFVSCTKIDLQNLVLHQENFAKKFFSTKQSTVNKDVQEIITKLKEQNTKSGFVEKLPRNYGLPIWEKSGYVSTNTSGNKLTESLTSGDYIYVPLAETNKGLSAIIVAHQQNDSLDIRFYSKDYLYDVCHATDLDTAKAENLLTLFFAMENYCFGTTVFHHIPAQLFKNSKEIDSNGDKIIRIKDNQDNQSTSSLIHCVTFYHCVNIAPCWAWYCDRCPLCETTICHNHDDPPPGGGGGTGGGGTGGGGTGGGGGGTGGGGGSGNCGQVFYLVDPCDDPPPPPPPVPCDTFIIRLTADSTFKAKFNILNSQAVTTLTYEKGFLAVDKNANNYTEQTGSLTEAIIPYSISGSISGLLHSHFAGYNSIFSIDDLEFMSRLFLNGNARDSANLFFGMTSNDANPYLLKVTNTTKFRLLAQRITSTEKKYVKIKKMYEDKINTPDIAANEKAFLQMLNDYGAGDGVSLFRSNSNLSQWSRLSVDNFGTVFSYSCMQEN
jgi:uncharacterized membrane protein YgcG